MSAVLIWHEYAADKMPEIYAAVEALAPELIAVVGKVIANARELEQKFPAR